MFCCSVTWFFRSGCHHFLQPIFAILLHHDLKNICYLQPHSHVYLETTNAYKHGPIMLHLSELVPLPLLLRISWSFGQASLSKASILTLLVKYQSFLHWWNKSVDLKNMQLEYLGIDRTKLLWFYIRKTKANWQLRQKFHYNFHKSKVKQNLNNKMQCLYTCLH